MSKTIIKDKYKKIPKLVEEKIVNEYDKNIRYPHAFENTIIDVVSVGFASSDKNPMTNVLLHDNKNPDIIFPIENIQKTHKQYIWRQYVF